MRYKNFTSGDVHGHFDEWMLSLSRAGFDPNNPQHRIIIVGDLFDRGRQSKQILEFINRDNIKNKIVFVKGNHEELIEDAIKRNDFLPHDIHNGTMQTFYDLYPDLYLSDYWDLKAIADSSGLTDYLNKCIDFFETDKYIFVHGWIPLNMRNGRYKYNPDWRKATKQKWHQARWFSCLKAFQEKLFEPNKTIVCGHWHCSSLWHYDNPNKYDEFGDKEKFDPYITEDIIALDACTAHSHKVNVVVIDDTGGE